MKLNNSMKISIIRKYEKIRFGETYIQNQKEPQLKK